MSPPSRHSLATDSAPSAIMGRSPRWGCHGTGCRGGTTSSSSPQLARRPLLDNDDVDTRTVIGPLAQRPLVLDIPIFVSDMSW